MDEVISVLSAVATIALLVGLFWWVRTDANARGKPGWLIACLVAFGGCIGIVLWLLLRPSRLVPSGPRLVDDTDCPRCGTRVMRGAACCSYCRLPAIEFPVPAPGTIKEVREF